jgi:hypothetical protein
MLEISYKNFADYLFVTGLMTGPESVKAACEEHPLCVIAFLPHILDCQVNHCCSTEYTEVSLFLFFFSNVTLTSLHDAVPDLNK